MTADNANHRGQPGSPWPLFVACAGFLLVALVTASTTFRYIRVPDVDALLGSAVVLVAWSCVLLVCWRWPPAALGDRLVQCGTWLTPRIGSVALVLALAVFAITLFTAIVTLQTFPNSADEYVQLFQAATFLDGRLTNPMPPDEIASAFRTEFTQYEGGRWFGRYPPGWADLLAAWHAIGLSYRVP